MSSALERADQGLRERLSHWRDERRGDPGLFCCWKCSVGLWRNLLSGGLDRQRERLRSGVRALRARRDGQGKWRGFPFWYAVLALGEIAEREAKAELQYAAPALTRAAVRTRDTTTYAVRRAELARRALAQV